MRNVMFIMCMFVSVAAFGDTIITDGNDLTEIYAVHAERDAYLAKKDYTKAIERMDYIIKSPIVNNHYKGGAVLAKFMLVAVTQNKLNEVQSEYDAYTDSMLADPNKLEHVQLFRAVKWAYYPSTMPDVNTVKEVYTDPKVNASTRGYCEKALLYKYLTDPEQFDIMADYCLKNSTDLMRTKTLILEVRLSQAKNKPDWQKTSINLIREYIDEFPESPSRPMYYGILVEYKNRDLISDPNVTPKQAVDQQIKNFNSVKQAGNFGKGLLLIKENRINEAIVCLEEVQTSADNDNLAWRAAYKLGECYEQLNDTEKAREKYQWIIDNDPKSAAYEAAVIKAGSLR